MNNKYVRTLIFLLLVFNQLAMAGMPQQTLNLRVGIYHNPPLEFIDEKGLPKGFVVDILQEIAREEGWKLEFVFCEWSDCLQMLENGQIDLMGAIAITDERSQRFDFNAETYFINWGVIYAQPGKKVESILELENSPLAIVREDVYASALIERLDQFDLSVTFVEMPDYQAVLVAVDQGQAEAGVVSRLFGLQFAQEYQVEQTPILFSPSELRFAVTKDRNHPLLISIDNHLSNWKDDPGSVYYRSLDQWLSITPVSWKPPWWLPWAAGGVFAWLAVFLAAILILRARVQARTADLRASEARYRRLFEESPVALWEEDMTGVKHHLERLKQQGIDDLPAYFQQNPQELLNMASMVKVLDVNSKTVKMYEAASKQELMTNLSRVFTPESLSVFEQNILAMWQGEHPIASETVTQTLSGKDIHINFLVNIFPDGSNSWGNVLIATPDITERRKMEDALRQSQLLFQTLAEHAPVGIWYATPDGSGNFINPMLSTITGLSMEEASGNGWARALHPDDYQRVFNEWVQFVRGEISYSSTYRFVRPDGSIHWVMGRAEAARDTNGELLGFIGTLTDITDMKLAEQSLRESEERYRQLNAELENRVAARTAQLESKNKDLETFAYTVSHDLKAPLRGIDGYSRLLLEDHSSELDAEGQNFLHIIRQSIAQMNKLIDDLLNYARMEIRAVSFETIRLEEIVNSVLNERDMDIDERNVDIHVNIVCPTVTTDGKIVSQALRNVLDNALKFTTHTSNPRIEIASQRIQSGCIISVSDNGIGFDMKHHDHIFEIFQRLHHSDEYSGTGVGLAIARKAIEKVGGRLWAESEPGKGSIFHLEIPCAD